MAVINLSSLAGWVRRQLADTMVISQPRFGSHLDGALLRARRRLAS
jgi:hypothetical protein